MYRLKSNIGLPDGQEKACAFIRLGMHLTPANSNMPPWDGVHAFHVLLLFPLNEDRFSCCRDWSLPRHATPLVPGHWVHASGAVVGVLNPDAVEGLPSSNEDTNILVIYPTAWEFIRTPQSAATQTPLDRIRTARKERKVQRRITDWFKRVDK